MSRVRILYLVLSIIIVWAREADNLESAYQASALVTLHSWGLLADKIANDRTLKKEAGHSLFEVVGLFCIKCCSTGGAWKQSVGISCQFQA